MDRCELKKWVECKDIINKAIEGFWVCFNNYMNEDREEFQEFFGNFDKNKIKLWFKEVRLTVRNWDDSDDSYWIRNDDEYNCNNEFIDALIIISYGKERSIGEYTMRFDKDGESFDDFFVMEWKDWAITIRKNIEKEVNVKLAKAALIQGIDKELISKVTGLRQQDIIEVSKKFKL